MILAELKALKITIMRRTYQTTSHIESALGSQKSKKVREGNPLGQFRVSDEICIWKDRVKGKGSQCNKPFGEFSFLAFFSCCRGMVRFDRGVQGAQGVFSLA